jgi:tRNA (mo5U34)-methyltransferase
MPQPIDIADLLTRAREFRTRLSGVKAKIAPPDFPWYPFDTLSGMEHLNRLLTGENRFLLSLAGEGPVVDIGCADGDLAFFLESLGCQAQVIDNPAINHNGMRGLNALKEGLGSAIEIHTVDLDSQFVLPAEQYHLALLLGVLYHLKNPIYVLEALSRQARFCLLSTRILPRDTRPIAYLADAYELHEEDDSNFWLFSEAGLRLLLKRTNWEIYDFLTVGDDSDLRAFCLVRSRYALGHLELLEGWHAAEPPGHRWTAKSFSAIGKGLARPKALRLKFYVPPAVLDHTRSVTLSAVAGGVNLGPATYTESGVFTYHRRLPRIAGDVRVDFALDYALPPDASDNRERGIIVSALDLE